MANPIQISSAGTPAQQDPPRTTPLVPFELLPEAIRDHLNSRASSDLLSAIEQEYKIPDDKVRVMPVILAAVVTGDLAAQDVVEALQVGLGVNPENAIKIATALKEKILNPIAGGLLMTTGIDIGTMPGAMPSDDLPALLEELQPIMDLERIKAEEVAEAANHPPLAPIAEIERPQDAPVPISELRPSPSVSPLSVKSSESEFKAPPRGTFESARPSRPMSDIQRAGAVEQSRRAPSVDGFSNSPTPKLTNSSTVPPAPKITSAPKPFMLHEEKPMPSSTPLRPTSYDSKPSFSYEAPILSSAYKETSKPASARFGSSFDNFSKKNEPAPPTAKTAAPEPAKIVHYSALKTPLDSKDGVIANNANETGNNANGKPK